MKLALNIFILFLVLQTQGQEKVSVIKVSKNAEVYKTPGFKLKRKKTGSNTIITVPFNFLASALRISDFIEEIPDECKTLTCKFDITFKNHIRSTICPSNGITLEARGMLNLLKPGDKFFIDNLTTPCADNLKKLYTFVIK